MLVVDRGLTFERSCLQYSSLMMPELKQREAKVCSDDGEIKSGVVGLRGRNVMYWMGVGKTMKEKREFWLFWFCMSTFDGKLKVIMQLIDFYEYHIHVCLSLMDHALSINCRHIWAVAGDPPVLPYFVHETFHCALELKVSREKL